MKTLHALTLLASVLSFTACTDAEAPPPRLSGVITPEGCGINSATTFPEMNAKAARLSARATAADVDALDLLGDGDDRYDVSCTFSETAALTAHNIAIEIKRDSLDFRLHAQTANRMSTTGTLAFKFTPSTGNATYQAQNCTVNTFHELEGGGAGLIAYDCRMLSNELLGRTCGVTGAVYVTDCKR